MRASSNPYERRRIRHPRSPGLGCLESAWILERSTSKSFNPTSCWGVTPTHPRTPSSPRIIAQRHRTGGQDGPKTRPKWSRDHPRNHPRSPQDTRRSPQVPPSPPRSAQDLAISPQGPQQSPLRPFQMPARPSRPLRMPSGPSSTPQDSRNNFHKLMKVIELPLL